MLSNNLTYFNYEKKFFFIAVSAIVAVSAGIFAYLNSESKSDDMFSWRTRRVVEKSVIKGFTILLDMKHFIVVHVRGLRIVNLISFQVHLHVIN